MATRAIARRRFVRYLPRARRHAAKTTLPLAVLAGFVPLGMRGYNGFKGNGWAGAVDGVSSGLTGYSIFEKTWEPDIMLANVTPILGGFLVHTIANRLGINRALGRAKVPLLRI